MKRWEKKRAGEKDGTGATLHYQRKENFVMQQIFRSKLFFAVNLEKPAKIRFSPQQLQDTLLCSVAVATAKPLIADAFMLAWRQPALILLL